MDGAIEKLLARLEADFDAALARDEEIAATDLAGSFERGLGLRERLCCSGGGVVLLLPDGVRHEVSVVADDYCACGDPEFLITRLDRAGFALTDAVAAPVVGRSTFAQAVRRWSEASTPVQVASTAGSFSGSLAVAAQDHVILEAAAGRIVLPLAAVETLRLARVG